MTASEAPAPSVSAVLVVRDGARWLPETLDAVAAQTRPPERLLIVDLASSDGSRDIVADHVGIRRAVGQVEVRHVATPSRYAEAVTTALRDPALTPSRPGGSAEWVWLLHDDGAPDPESLARLLAAVGRSPSVGVAGPKIVRWEDPRTLVEVGVQLTRAGRRISSPHPGERDQGQYDARADVIAVATNGMLVRRDVYDEMGGLDPSFGPLGVDVDFGWRAQLAGHRVVVVPSARVREASASATGDRQGAPSLRGSERARRVAARRVALARCAWWTMPLLGVWIALSSLLGFVVLLVLKRPRHAWAELGDLAALAAPARILRSRWQARRQRQVSPRHLHGLFVSTGSALRQTWDAVQEALTPSWTAERRASAAQLRPVESGPVAEEAEDLHVMPASLPRRVFTNPGVLVAIVATVAAGVLWRSAIAAGVLSPTGRGLAGGELFAVTTNSAGLWHSAQDSWHGAGLGEPGAASPFLALLAGMTWLAEWFPGVGAGRSPAAVTVAWTVLLALPASAVVAYLAGRVATTRRWPRAAIALLWAGAPVGLSALSQGRVAAVLAHLLLPAVVAGFVRVCERSATATATFATALGIGVVGACVPIFLGVGALAALVLLAVGPGAGRRWRAMVLLVVPTALMGPWLKQVLDDPAVLLGTPGLLQTADSAGRGINWPLALGRLDEPTSAWPYLVVPVLLPVVAALVWPRRGRASAVATLGLGLLAALGLGLAATLPALRVGDLRASDGAIAAASSWAGLGLELYSVAVAALALLGLTLSTSGHDERAAVRATARVAAVVVGVFAAAAVASGVWLQDVAVRPIAADAVPAVATESANGPTGSRLLTVTRKAGVVVYRLDGREPGALQRGLAAPQPASDPVVEGLVRRIVGPGPSGADLSGALAEEGITFVGVSDEGDAEIARRLDAAAGLARLGATTGQVLWRVAARSAADDPNRSVPPARLLLTTSEGAALADLPMSGPHGAASAQLPASSGQRRLRVAESVEWSRHAVVSADGQVLTAVPVGDRPTYPLPAGAVRVDITVPPTDPWWLRAQLALLGVVVFLAVPFGSRRSRLRGFVG